MKKRLLAVLLLFACFCIMLLSCTDEESSDTIATNGSSISSTQSGTNDDVEGDFNDGEKPNTDPKVAVYASYVSYMNQRDETALSYEEWLDTIKGADGTTPSIGENGNWFFGTLDTGIPATGEKGADGVGVESIDFVDGEIIITYTDGKQVSLGKLSELLGDSENSALDFYPFDDGTYGVACGKAIYLSKIVIPATYKGAPVTTIVANGFANCINLKTCIIPNSISVVGENAFDGCDNLTILCQMSSAPTDWHVNWNPDSRPVIWNACMVEHSWKDATCTEPKTCTECGFSEGEALGHSEKTVAEGCAPTCTERGFTECKICTVCEKITVEQTVIPATGHTEVTLKGREATCTDSGLTEGKTCTVCKQDVKAQEIIPALGHNYNGDKICDRCGYVKTNGTEYTRVDSNTILFGSYPQTKVTDAGLINTLRAKAGTLPTSANPQAWTDYGYYISGKVESYMWYIDVESDGERYRGVYFTRYRPFWAEHDDSLENAFQYENGYRTGIVYWFKYEPISWTILTEENGMALILCDMIIDNQMFQKEYEERNEFSYVKGTDVYANDFEYSTIKAWLNEVFYETAFTDIQKEIILSINDTEDKVFLLNDKEATNTDYGYENSTTSDVAREKKTTDYAQSQGACTNPTQMYTGNGEWMLITTYNERSSLGHVVRQDGAVDNRIGIFDVSFGVVPLLKICL